MTDRECQLLTIIRGSKDPEALMLVALEAIIACQTPPVRCEAPYPAVLATAAGTAP